MSSKSQAILAELEESAEPVSTADLAARVNEDPGKTGALITYLVKTGRIVAADSIGNAKLWALAKEGTADQPKAQKAAASVKGKKRAPKRQRKAVVQVEPEQEPDSDFRCGVLSSGELMIINADNESTIYTEQQTEVIRSVLVGG